MSKVLSQTELERMVNGTSPSPDVVFYEAASLDVIASKEAGKRVYSKAVFVKKTYPGVTDWVPYRAQPSDMKEFPNEYELFLNTKQGQKEPGIDIVPGLDITHMQELVDLGVSTIKALAYADVPAHLQYAQDRAKRIYSAMKEEDHGEAQSNKENRSEGNETSPETIQGGRDIRADAVFERGSGPDGSDTADSGSNPQRLQESRRNNSGQAVGSDWSVSFDVG